MTPKQILGLAMLLTPFIVILTFTVMLLGWVKMLGILGFVFLIIFLTVGGVYLIGEEQNETKP